MEDGVARRASWTRLHRSVAPCVLALTLVVPALLAQDGAPGSARPPVQAPASSGTPAQSPAPQSAPAQSAPAQSVPAQSAPAQSAPAQSAPATTAPGAATDPYEQLGGAIGAELKDALELQKRGRQAREAGDLTLAIRYFEQALSSSKEQGWKGDQRAVLMTELGDALAESGESQRGSALLSAAEQLAASTSSHRVRLLALTRLGREQWLADRPDEARRSFEKALAVLNTSPDVELEVDVRLQLSRIYLERDQQNRALEQLNVLQGLLNSPTQRRMRAWVLEQSATLEAGSAILDAAARHYDEALVLYRSLQDVSGEATTLDARARLEAQRGQWKDAAALWRQAVKVWEGVPLPRQAVLALAEVARCHEQQEQWGQAREALELALQKARTSGLVGDVPGLQTRLGRVFQQQSELALAVKSFREAIAASSGSRTWTRWMAPLGLARVLDVTGSQEAGDSYLQALTALDETRADLTPDAIEAPWLSERQTAYEEAAARLLRKGQPEKALELTERARLRRFKDLLESRPGSPLLGALGSGRGHALKVTPPLAQALNGQLEEVLGGASPVSRLGSPRMPQSWDARRLQALARQQRTWVASWAFLGSELAGWVVTPEGKIEGKLLPTPRAVLEEKIGLLHARMLETESRPASGKTSGGVASRLDKGALELLRSLNDALLQPFASLLPQEEGARLALVVEGLPALIPFGLLVNPANQALIERYSVIASPLASLLEPLYVRRSVIWVGKSELFLFGEARRSGVSAPEERLELVRPVLQQGAFRSHPDVLNVMTGPEATDASVAIALKRPAAVQLMTRAFYHQGHPFLSGWVLSDTGEVTEADGLLTCAELPFGELQARVVVLPPFDAPELGKGRVSAVSLGWLTAGAQTLVYPVGGKGLTGATADRFYQGLMEGLSPMEALRRAQLAALLSGEPWNEVGALLLVGAI